MERLKSSSKSVNDGYSALRSVDVVVLAEIPVHLGSPRCRIELNRALIRNESPYLLGSTFLVFPVKCIVFRSN